MDAPDSLTELLWVTPLQALAVVLATTGMYVAIVVLVRLLGQRVLSGLSGFDLAAVIAFGAILGRASLGHAPVLGGGLIALTTLLVLQALAGQLRLRHWGAAVVTRRPVLLMADGRPIEMSIRRAHVGPEELQSRLRIAGVRHPDEVAAVILEPSGAVSVLKKGHPIDPQLLEDVIGAQLVPEHLLNDPGSPTP